jgi:HSP90 family molecular chaperone
VPQVLFVYNTIDDFVMTNLTSYNKRKIVSAEAKDLDLAKAKKQEMRQAAKKAAKEVDTEGDDDAKEAAAAKAKAADEAAEAADKAAAEAAAGPSLSAAEVASLGDWLVATLPSKLGAVTATTRLKGSPAIVTDHESGALRRMMRMVEQQNGGVAVNKEHEGQAG